MDLVIAVYQYQLNSNQRLILQNINVNIYHTDVKYPYL